MGARRCLSQITLKTQIFWNCRNMRYLGRESHLPWTDKWNWNCFSLFIRLHSPLMCVKTKVFSPLWRSHDKLDMEKGVKSWSLCLCMFPTKKHKQLNTLAIAYIVWVKSAFLLSDRIYLFHSLLTWPSDHKVYIINQTVAFNFLFTT